MIDPLPRVAVTAASNAPDTTPAASAARPHRHPNLTTVHDKVPLLLLLSWCCVCCANSNQEAKRARKEAQKEERQKALEEKRSAIDTMLASMTEEQRKEWRQKQKVPAGSRM